MHVGFASYFCTHLYEDEERASSVARLLLDSRWPWPPTSTSFGIGKRWGQRSARRKLTGHKAHASLVAGILDPGHRDVAMEVKPDTEENYARLLLKTGQVLPTPEAPFPATLTGHTKATNLPVGKDLVAWVDLLHELMLTLDIGHGVLPVWPTEDMVDSDTVLVRIRLSAAKGERDLGVTGEFEIQRARAEYWRHELGDKYLRHPRWGTYLRRCHLDRVGGLALLRDTVPLAKILELGGPHDLIYLQCTDHPKGALTPDGEAVRQALQTFLEPILVPPRPQELAPQR
ncbi:MAG: hypothetical protein R3B48_14085 [Kofleriaceae bacterium]